MNCFFMYLQFQIYRNCKSIEDEENCMIWLNMSLYTRFQHLK